MPRNQRIVPPNLGEARVIRVGRVDGCAESQRDRGYLRVSGQVACGSHSTQEVKRCHDIARFHLHNLHIGLFKPFRDMV